MELCVRCGYPATALMTFSYSERVVTLTQLVGVVRRPPGALELCAGHALSKTAPVGWVLNDELGSELSLFTVEADNGS
ncbi:MAG: DUF3499 family protein [Acidimicrobiia bacterium]|nr:DUF3499 family protein [Acidimicrobiia bacterium]NNL28723.1 DUF3499 family protein [Acidimicrobiia bacterium]